VHWLYFPKKKKGNLKISLFGVVTLETDIHESVATVRTTDCRLCISNNILPSISHISDCPSKDLRPSSPTNLSHAGHSNKKNPIFWLNYASITARSIECLGYGNRNWEAGISTPAEDEAVFLHHHTLTGTRILKVFIQSLAGKWFSRDEVVAAWS